MTAVLARPTSRDAYTLVHRGALALARVAHAGMKIDVGYLTQAIKDTEAQQADLEKQLTSDKVWRRWRKKFGDKAKLSSRAQLAVTLRFLGYDVPVSERSEREVADEEVLIKIDLPFVRDYEKWFRLGLARNTFLEGIRKELVDGFVHPSFHLNLAETHRSSASSPNVQNQIRRNKELAEIVRRCFVSRFKNGKILEVDMSAHEFRVASAVWNDPAMIAYAADPGKDVHRDLAMKIFKCKAGDVKACKGLRDCAKNQVTFPTLYGSWWLKMAKHVWDFIDRHSLVVAGVPAKDWLAKKGVKSLGRQDPRLRPEAGTFERVMQEVEDWFNSSFTVFSEGKKRRWEQYQKRGWFNYTTGFRVTGHHTKNFLLNSIVQGPAFHVVLWDLVEAQRRMRKLKMRSLIIAEVHDSLILDAADDELDDLLPMLREVMTVSVRKHWPWITVPLEVEAEAGSSWWEKNKVAI